MALSSESDKIIWATAFSHHLGKNIPQTKIFFICIFSCRTESAAALGTTFGVFFSSLPPPFPVHFFLLACFLFSSFFVATAAVVYDTF